MREGKAPGQGARGLESPSPPARPLPPEGAPWLVKALKIRPGAIFQILLPPEGAPWLVKALKIRPGANLDAPKPDI